MLLISNENVAELGYDA